MTGGIYPSQIYPTSMYPSQIYSSWVIGSGGSQIINIDYPLVGTLTKKIYSCSLPVTTKTTTFQNKTFAATLFKKSYTANITLKNLTAVLDQ